MSLTATPVWLLNTSRDGDSSASPGSLYLKMKIRKVYQVLEKGQSAIERIRSQVIDSPVVLFVVLLALQKPEEIIVLLFP